MAVESQKQDTENQDSNGGGDFEVSYEDYRDSGASYEDYGVIPEGYDESFEDTVENKSTHAALLEDQNRKKHFAKQAWTKVARKGNNTDRKDMEEGEEPQNEDSNVDHSASSTGDDKTERKKVKEKKEGERDDSEFSHEKKPRRKNFVETIWPSGSEEGGDLDEEVLVSLINN